MKLSNALTFLNKVYPRLFSVSGEEAARLYSVIRGLAEWLAMAERECASGSVSLPDEIELVDVNIADNIYDLSAIKNEIGYIHDALEYLLGGDVCERLAMYEDSISGKNELIEVVSRTLKRLANAIFRSATVVNFVMRYW